MRITFSTYSLILTYLMSALGISSIILAGAMDAVFITSICVLVFSSLVMNLNGKTFIPRSVWNILAIALFCFFILDYLSISRDLIVSASRFLMVMLAFKLFDLKRMRDHITAFGLVFFQILAAAVSTVSPVFFLILSLFILTSMIAVIIFTLKRDFAQARGVAVEAELPRDILGPGFLASIFVISLVSITITMALFFVMPRMGMGFFERKTLDTVKTTGFNDTVRLGSIGPVKTDTTVVMRVELPVYAAKSGAAREPFYLRGTALDSYDGESWTRSDEGKKLVRKDASGVVRLGSSERMLFEQHILLEALDTEVVFAASHPVSIMEGQGSRKLTNLWTDRTGSVYLPSPPYSTLDYTVWSETGPQWEEPGLIDRAYTDDSYLDTIEDGPAIRALASQITAGRGGDAAKARSIVEHLGGGGYTYTLEPGHRGADNPLADFLLHTREGYCEHFATALAMMLRSTGIPSRIVTGFVPGEWNSHGGYYIVRQQDAHSWVEAYLSGTGWVTLDPTPPAGLAPSYRPSEIMLYMDMLRWKWNRYVVQYTSDDQRRVAADIEGRFTELSEGVRTALRNKGAVAGGYLPYLAAVVLILGAVVIVVLRRSDAKGLRNQKIPSYYREMLRILERKGVVRTPSETPFEFARRVQAPGVCAVTEAFCRERYAGLPPESGERELIDRAVEELRGCDLG